MIGNVSIQFSFFLFSNEEKVEIYYPKPPCNRCELPHSPGKDSLLVKDETFPELGVGSVEGCDDQESVCSSNDREGDAFPKAFDRDLVTPTNNLQKAQASESTIDSVAKPISANQSIDKSVSDTKDKDNNESKYLRKLSFCDMR